MPLVGTKRSVFLQLIICFCTPLPVRKASVTNDADVLAAVDVSHYPDGQAVSLESVFGNSLNYDDAGRVVSASIFMQVNVAIVQHIWTKEHAFAILTITT